MMNETFITLRLKHFLSVGYAFTHRLCKRTLLSQAYRCEEAWDKRLESPLLRSIKIDKYFMEVDKKFATKKLASGVDIDLFAINIQDPNKLDELEHLLYRFRMTKRATEMMDSTIHAVVRVLLKFKDYETLFRILDDQENYGIFPDLVLYNILMDTFIEQKMFKEAAKVAVLMMLQEDFSNEISSFLAVYSCHQFLKNHSIDELYPKPELEQKEEDEEEEEEILVRVPFYRNPWFDDHFHLTEPRHLIGKTYFLAAHQMKDNLLGKTFQLLGLGMYEKWDAALEMLNSLAQSESPVLLSEGVDEFKKYMDSLSDENVKKKFEDLLKKMEGNQIASGDLENHLNAKIGDLPELEKRDIELQVKLFGEWEKERQIAFHKQNLELDKQRRLEEIAKKKEYLFWKEKMLFFFENEDWILEEYKKAKEVEAIVKSQKTEDETYVVPEILKKKPEKLTEYQKHIRVKKINI